MRSYSGKGVFRRSAFNCKQLPRAAGVLLLFAASAVTAATVSYSTTDLVDVVIGQDRWRYHYTIAAPLPAFNYVNLLFDPSLYANLVVHGSTPDLSVFETQPDTFLPADGQVTVMALTDILGATTETVDLDFVWLGAGQPGGQSYELLDDFFNDVSPSPLQTHLAGSQSLPVPGSLSLLALGLLALPALRLRPRFARKISE
jgi:hypothetical protein